MIIVCQNDKIIGISKNLAQDLNLSLENISSLINTLELELKSLTNETLTINNTTFKVEKNELISTENLNVFSLQKIESAAPDTFYAQPSFEDSIAVNITEHKEEAPNMQPLSFEPSQDQINTTHSEEPSILNTTDSQPQIQENPTFQEPTPEEEIDENGEIDLVFEDKLSEIRELLENSEKLKETIEDELKKVTQELGIDEEMAKQLFNDLLNQIKEEKENFYQLIKNKDYEGLHKTAHKLKGAALNLRISSLALILKNLDELSKEKENIDTIKYIVDAFYQLLEQIEENKPIKIDDEFILEALKEYVRLGDEEKFQKEKKYLEKTLNITIKDLAEAEKIIKANS